MQNNPAEDWQRLTEHYRALSDEELEELAADFVDLTETAREVLRNEMRSRGLDDPASARSAPALQSAAKEPPQAPLELRNAPWKGDPVDMAFGAFGARAPELVPDTPDTGSEADGSHDYTWKTVLCDCETSVRARQLVDALQRAGIDSWVDGPGSNSRYGSSGLANPRVLVAADQLEEAIAIARQPVPQDIIDDLNQQVPEYVPPKCPKCGAEDPVLESAEPSNSWLCEACGEQWTEPATDLEGKPEAAG
jgi:hypothetical protein